tara:strand:- start:3562 stop:4101 length:540 start_codon:yes stop_codon:yes gene_type:complete
MNQIGNAIAAMNIPLKGIGRYTDEFYPTAVGDYLMSQKIPNVLIESGVSSGDMQRTRARKFGVGFIRAMLSSNQVQCDLYDLLPLNEQGQLEWVFTDVLYAHMRVDIAVKRVVAMNGHQKAEIYVVDDLGDLSSRPRLYEIPGSSMGISDVLTVDRPVTGVFGTVVFEQGQLVIGNLPE